MSWYYVENDRRLGPFDNEKMRDLFEKGAITPETFVWTKGFKNWRKLKEELNHFKRQEQEQKSVHHLSISELPLIKEDFDWEGIDRDDRIFSIKIGIDRGCPEREYAPYSIHELKRAFNEKRINGKTLVFSVGMEDWMFLAETPIFVEMSNSPPPMIENEDRRKSKRRPFVARILFHGNSKVYEGICRDISLEGLQVLIDNFPGQVRDTISMNVHPENSSYSFVASGEIVRFLEGKKGFSLRFFNLGEDAIKAIGVYLE